MLSREQFIITFYKWCQAEADAEIVSNYTRLESFGNEDTLDALRFLRLLAPRTQKLILNSRVRCFNRDMASLAGDPPTDEDEAMNNEFIDGWRYQRNARIIRLEPTCRQKVKKSISVGRLRSALEHSLVSYVTNALIVRASSKAMFIEHGWEDYVLRTHIEFSSRPTGSLLYYQSLLSHGEPLLRSSSIQAWLGISGMTTWTDLTEEGVGQATATLAGIVQYYLEQVTLMSKA